MKILAFAVVATAGLAMANLAAADPIAADGAVGDEVSRDLILDNDANLQGNGEDDLALLPFLFHKPATTVAQTPDVPRASGQGGKRSNDKTQFGVVLRSGQSYGDNDDTTFLNYMPAEIRGIKFEDVNGDGVEDSEDTNPISGITINLYRDLNSDGVLQASDGAPLMTTTTDNAGRWGFTDLDPGFYIVEEVLSGGYLTEDETGFDVQLSSNEFYGDNDDTTFLNFKPAEIHGVKLLDMDGDGIEDPEDTTPIAGVTINLHQDRNGDGVLQDADGGPIMTTVTNDAGEWSFVGLVPGSYIVQEVF